jgi:dihydroorotase
LVEPGILPLEHVLAAMSVKPAQLFGLDAGRLEPGAPADLCLFDPNAEVTVDAKRFLSKGRNSPYQGHTLKGRIRHTFCAGRLVYSA